MNVATRESSMTEQAYEIDIDAGHEDEQMQVDDAPGVRQRGRGFGGTGAGSHLGSRNANATSQGPATAVRSIEGWIILVTNVHEEASEEQVNEAFADFGEVQQIHLNLDRRTGYVKGYALIEYATLDEAKAAIAGASKLDILGQSVNADFAFIRGPNPRGNRFGSSGGRGANRRPRSQSPGAIDGGEAKSLESRIESS